MSKKNSLLDTTGRENKKDKLTEACWEVRRRRLTAHHHHWHTLTSIIVLVVALVVTLVQLLPPHTIHEYLVRLWLSSFSVARTHFHSESMAFPSSLSSNDSVPFLCLTSSLLSFLMSQYRFFFYFFFLSLSPVFLRFPDVPYRLLPLRHARFYFPRSSSSI